MSAAAMFDPDGRVAMLLDSVELVAADRFRVGGGAAIDVAAINAMPRPAPPQSVLASLTQALATILYLAGYARLYRGEAIAPGAFDGAMVPDSDFVAALSTANTTSERWDAGWRVYRAEQNGALNVVKGDTALFVQPGSYASAALGGAAPSLGSLVEVLLRRESLTQQPGWYVAHGATPASDHDLARIARCYFNVPAPAAARLVGRLTRALNRYQIPFQLKCPGDPRHYDRADALVLYVGRRWLSATLGVLQSDDALVSLLDPGTPLCTRVLAAGLGGADDPGTGESFGQSRARLLAGAIVDAGPGRPRGDTRHTALVRRFVQAGLDPARPHVSSGLVDGYDVGVAEAA